MFEWNTKEGIAWETLDLSFLGLDYFLSLECSFNGLDGTEWTLRWCLLGAQLQLLGPLSQQLQCEISETLFKGSQKRLWQNHLWDHNLKKEGHEKKITATYILMHLKGVFKKTIPDLVVCCWACSKCGVLRKYKVVGGNAISHLTGKRLNGLNVVLILISFAPFQ